MDFTEPAEAADQFAAHLQHGSAARRRRPTSTCYMSCLRQSR